MSKLIVRICLLLLSSIVLVLLWYILPGRSPRHELSALPGAVAYTEGDTSVPELFEEAKQWLAQGDAIKAEAIYRDIIQIEPENAAGYIGLAACRFFQDDLTGAEQQYRQALQRNPHSTMALLGLGSVAYRHARYDQAVGWYQQALTRDASLADAHLGLALSYDSLADMAAAREHYERFLELAPDSGYAEQARTRFRELQISPSQP